jgi:hypothetical protein
MYKLLYIPTGECVIFNSDYAGDINILKPQVLEAACEEVVLKDTSKCRARNYVSSMQTTCRGCPWFVGGSINKAEYLFEICD